MLIALIKECDHPTSVADVYLRGLTQSLLKKLQLFLQKKNQIHPPLRLTPPAKKSVQLSPPLNDTVRLQGGGHCATIERMAFCPIEAG